jgi:large subunit ribosomal protein L15
MKTNKRSKVSRMSGKGMGTHGSGARKNKRKSGNKGGTGLAGTGKRADHKKTMVQKLYGHKYFGKQGVTRGMNARDTRQRINLKDITLNLEKYGKKKGDSWELDLKKHKILGIGEVKEKLIIDCLEISKSAREKIEKAGGKVIVKEIKKAETPLVQHVKVKK